MQAHIVAAGQGAGDTATVPIQTQQAQVAGYPEGAESTGYEVVVPLDSDDNPTDHLPKVDGTNN